jgi:diketogulonate reductase-like aldo/keto reductase
LILILESQIFDITYTQGGKKMESKRVADLTVEELRSILLETKQVSELTVGELKAIIAEVVDLRLSYWLNTVNKKSSAVLPKRTKEEQMQRNLAAIEWLRTWREEGDTEEQTKTFEYLQKVLDLVNQKSSAVLPETTQEAQMQQNLEIVEWLDKWAEEGDEEEQRETFEYLQKALDEDRLSSQRLLFQTQ